MSCIIKIFDNNYINNLISQAKCSSRQRQHRNVHESYEDACQRFFDAIEPGSYIRPHRHATDPKEELLIAIRGTMAFVDFDAHGAVIDVVRLGVKGRGDDIVVGVEVSANTWHTVVALEPGCVLLEIKAGPFDPNQPKDLAYWAPEEGGANAEIYLQQLTLQIARFGLSVY